MKKLTGELSEPSVLLLNRILGQATIPFGEAQAAVMLQMELRAFLPVNPQDITPSADQKASGSPLPG